MAAELFGQSVEISHMENIKVSHRSSLSIFVSFLPPSLSVCLSVCLPSSVTQMYVCVCVGNCVHVSVHLFLCIDLGRLFDFLSACLSDRLSLCFLYFVQAIRGLSYGDRLVIPIIDNEPEERLLVEPMREAMEKNPLCGAVLVRRHGLFLWAESWQKVSGGCALCR